MNIFNRFIYNTEHITNLISNNKSIDNDFFEKKTHSSTQRRCL